MTRTLLVLLVLFGVTALAQQEREGRGQALLKPVARSSSGG